MVYFWGNVNKTVFFWVEPGDPAEVEVQNMLLRHLPADRKGHRYIKEFVRPVKDMIATGSIVEVKIVCPARPADWTRIPTRSLLTSRSGLSSMKELKKVARCVFWMS